MNYGIGIPFQNRFGGMGFASGPPDKDSIIQWLNYLKSDGITLNDKLEVITPEPTLVNVNVMGMGLNATGGIAPLPDRDTGLGVEFPPVTLPFDEEWEVSFSVQPLDSIATTNLITGSTSSEGRIATNSSGKLLISSSIETLLYSYTLQVGVWSDIVITSDGTGDISVSMDGSAPEVQSFSPTAYMLLRAFGSKRSGSSYLAYSGLFQNIKISNWLHYPCACGNAGSVFDVSGHDNHGATGSNVVSYNYSDVADGRPSWNHSEGFALKLDQVLENPDDITAAGWGGTAARTSPTTADYSASGQYINCTASSLTKKGDSYRFSGMLSSNTPVTVRGRIFRNGAGTAESGTQDFNLTSTPQLCEFDYTFLYPQDGARWDVYNPTAQVFTLTVTEARLYQVDLIPALADDAVLNSYSIAILAAYSNPTPSGSIDAGGLSPRIEVMDERQVLLDDYSYTLISEGDLPS